MQHWQLREGLKTQPSMVSRILKTVHSTHALHTLYIFIVSTNLTIEKLQYQCNPWNRKHPTIRLSWQTPICQVSPRDIEYVVYANDEELQVISGPATSVVLSTLTPLKSYKFRVTARHRRTKEEGLYYQSFEIFLGEQWAAGTLHTYMCTCTLYIHVYMYVVTNMQIMHAQ